MTDYALGSTIYLRFTTRAFATGIPTQLAGSPVLSVLEENNATPITSGVSVSVDRASVAGLNEATIVATTGNGYESGKEYALYISTGTVSGVSVVGEVVGQFTIEKSSALRPTTTGRTLDVTSTGGAGIDWANVESPTTTLALTGTTIASTQKVDVDTVKTNPVVNGGTLTFPANATLASTTNITAGTITTTTTATNVTTVNGLAAGVITAASIAADAITDAKVAADVTIASVTGAVGSVTGAVGSVTGSVGSVVAQVSADVTAISGDSTAADNAERFFDGTGYAGTNNVIPVVTTATNVTTVNGLAANVLTAAATAADFVSEISGGGLDAAGVRAALGMASANLDTQLADLPTNTELATALVAADDAVLAAIAALNNLSQVNIRTAVGLASANLDTQLADLPTTSELTAALGTADDAVLAAVAALHNLSAAEANAEIVDALAVDTYAEPAQGAPGATIPLAAKINYIYKFLRNEVQSDVSGIRIYADDGSTVDHKSPHADDGTTYTRGKFITGP